MVNYLFKDYDLPPEVQLPETLVTMTMSDVTKDSVMELMRSRHAYLRNEVDNEFISCLEKTNNKSTECSQRQPVVYPIVPNPLVPNPVVGSNYLHRPLGTSVPQRSVFLPPSSTGLNYQAEYESVSTSMLDENHFEDTSVAYVFTEEGHQLVARKILEPVSTCQSLHSKYVIMSRVLRQLKPTHYVVDSSKQQVDDYNNTWKQLKANTPENVVDIFKQCQKDVNSTLSYWVFSVERMLSTPSIDMFRDFLLMSDSSYPISMCFLDSLRDYQELNLGNLSSSEHAAYQKIFASLSTSYMPQNTTLQAVPQSTTDTTSTYLPSGLPHEQRWSTLFGRLFS